MNDEEKQIEEMAKVINNPERNWCEITVRCSDCPYTNKSCKEYTCRDYAYAETLYNAGYRNCKDKVVLSREEYEKLKMLEEGHITCDDVYEYVVKARKETAREIILEMFNQIKGYENIDIILNHIAKQYGVEVE